MKKRSKSVLARIWYFARRNTAENEVVKQLEVGFWTGMDGGRVSGQDGIPVLLRLEVSALEWGS